MTSGGNLSLQGWNIIILFSISVLFLILLVRSHYEARRLKAEFKKIKHVADSAKRDYLDSIDQLRQLEVKFERSSQSIESLHRHISSLVDHSKGMVSQDLEEHFNPLFELIQNQKTLIFKAMTAASGEESTTMVISDLINFVEEISVKSKVIHDIAFKTKVLSFNASVEAERAGVRGRGFSIVAQEMKRLAEISGKASEDIASLVERTRRGTQVLSSSSDSGGGVSMQNTIIEASGTLDQIQTKLNQCNQFFNEVVNQQGMAQNHLHEVTEIVQQMVVKSQNETQQVDKGTHRHSGFINTDTFHTAS